MVVEVAHKDSCTDRLAAAQLGEVGLRWNGKLHRHRLHPPFDLLVFDGRSLGLLIQPNDDAMKLILLLFRPAVGHLRAGNTQQQKSNQQESEHLPMSVAPQMRTGILRSPIKSAKWQMIIAIWLTLAAAALTENGRNSLNNIAWI